jgi:hypothetical protein
MSGSMTPPPPAGGATPPSAGAPSPGSPPIGSSPMTGPTQNLGKVAQGQKMVRALLDGMAMALAAVGVSTPLGQALSKALTDIGKHVPPDAGPNDAMRQMAAKQAQMAPHQAAMAGAKPAMPPATPPMAA